MRLARDNHRAGIKLFRGTYPKPFEVIISNAHQSVEKYLKAYLLKFRGKYPSIHQLDNLFERCCSCDEQFEEIRADVEMLSPFGVLERYPHQKEFDETFVDRALKACGRIEVFILGELDLSELAYVEEAVSDEIKEAVFKSLELGMPLKMIRLLVGVSDEQFESLVQEFDTLEDS